MLLVPPGEALNGSESREYEAPRGEVEEVLAGIWQELLHVERIGRNDNFFELGGHSLLIVQMMERLQRVGLSAEVRRAFESPTLSDLAGALVRGAGEETEVPPNLIPVGCERITPQMLPLVELEQEHIGRIARSVPGGAGNIQDIYPLTPLQEGILVHHLLSGPNRDAYVRPMLLEISSRTRLDELQLALQAIIDRHDILRTAILWEGLPRAVQVVHRHATLPVEMLTLDPDADTLRQLRERMRPECLQLDLGKAPQIRIQTALSPDGSCWFAILGTHHLVLDNESLAVLLQELAAHLHGRLTELPAHPYREHVAQVLARGRSSDSQAFFRKKLADVDEPSAPFGVLEANGDTTGPVVAEASLGRALASGLRKQARRFGVSAATFFHAVWAIVISGATGRDDVVYGTVLLGRLQSRAAAHRVPGTFINTLPLRIRLRDLTARELVERTQRELVELLEFQQSSPAEAQRCSAVPGATPLFGALLNYRHSGPRSGPTLTSDITLLAGDRCANFPLVLSVDDLGGEITLEIQAESPIDPCRVLEHVLAVSQALMEALERALQTPVLKLHMLPESERHQLIEVFNATRVPYPSEEPVHRVFESQAFRTPDAVAAVSDRETVTYAELNRRANQLAGYFRRKGMQPGELVPILLPRSLSMLIAQIAILKCGAAYVPLDPETPAQRLVFVLMDCGARRVVSDGPSAPEWIPDSVLWIDISRMGPRKERSAANVALDVSPLSAAYVMYTSGSTGTPKGVVVPHRAVNRLAINGGYADVGPADCIAHYSNPAFDASTFEVWGALLNGARVLIIPQAVVLDVPEFAKLLVAHQVTLLWMTVGLLNQCHDALSQVFAGLRYLITGGDVVDPEVVRSVLRRSRPRQMLNAYGPTECTTFSTTHRIEALDAHVTSVPIGRPISNTALYILDEHLRPLPLGATGELFIGGPGVALGYLNRPELTAERFLPDPFSGERDARMYRTGDLGKWRPDGTIEFQGRKDEQVKIRGFRIELGEIQAQLARHGSVSEAVVIAQRREGEKHLIAYVIPKGDVIAPSAETLREYLKEVLPEYMVPSAFVMLQEFPLTTNGKLDRRRLPAPDLACYVSREFEAPRGEVEEVLGKVWQELLHVERVGRNDNFFELGGHSLLGLKLLALIRDGLGCSLHVSAIFRYPTLMEMADAVAALREAGSRVVPNGQPEYEEGVIRLDAQGGDEASTTRDSRDARAREPRTDL